MRQKPLCYCWLLLPFLFLSCKTVKHSSIQPEAVITSSLNSSTDNAIVYSLPLTHLRIEVQIEKVIRKAGPYFRYSEKYLNITNVVTEDSETFRIIGVKITPMGKPDPDKTYSIRPNGSDVAQNICLNQMGILRGFNLNECIPEGVSNEFKPTKSEIQSVDVNFDAVPYIEKQLQKTSTATMAEEVANYIYKIRKRKAKIFLADYEILPPDGAAFELIDQELDLLEKQFVELFAGKTVSQVITRSFDYLPGLEGNNQTVLFRFSSKSGVLDRMDLSGAPVYIEITDLTNIRIPSEPVPDNKKPEKKGVSYCLPGMALVKIIDKNELLLEQEVSIAQFGQVLTLPPSLLQNSSSIELSPVTGALMHISK